MAPRICIYIALALLTGILFALYPSTLPAERLTFLHSWLAEYGRHEVSARSLSREQSDYLDQLAEAARKQVGVTKSYDPRYVTLAYPGGDVPSSTGVCTDVLIRAYRTLGADLQQLVHEDMRRDFAAYPQLWKLAKPDPSIDHRRVPNLMQFFRRAGAQLPIPSSAASYRNGDIVAWDLGGGVTHIGIISRPTPSERPMVIHNIGRGVQVEDVLNAWKKIGVFRYVP